MAEPSKGIWEGVSIPVLGVTGEKFTGKTLFVSSIDPENTVMIDCETSSASYNIPFKKRYDLYQDLGERHPTGWKPIHAYERFVEIIQKELVAGEQTVIAVDPVTDIESGHDDWVYEHAEDFGKTKNQFDKSGGIYWGVVKDHWKVVLAQITAKCQTFAFTAHMKSVFKGGAPTGQRAPKGKETLYEMASLYLHMERKIDKGVYLPPQAKLVKSRIGITRLDTSVTPPRLITQECLPPIILNCSPYRIRQYILQPYDPAKIKRGERIEEVKLTDDEKLLIHQEIAQNEVAKATVEVTRLEMLAAATKRQAEVRKRADVQASIAGTPPVSTPASPISHAHDKLAAIRRDLAVPEDQWQQILSKRGAKTLADLTPEQAEEIYQKLWSKSAFA